jgi:hypothetical protein
LFSWNSIYGINFFSFAQASNHRQDDQLGYQNQRLKCNSFFLSQFTNHADSFTSAIKAPPKEQNHHQSHVYRLRNKSFANSPFFGCLILVSSFFGSHFKFYTDSALSFFQTVISFLFTFISK